MKTALFYLLFNVIIYLLISIWQAIYLAIIFLIRKISKDKIINKEIKIASVALIKLLFIIINTIIAIALLAKTADKSHYQFVISTILTLCLLGILSALFLEPLFIPNIEFKNDRLLNRKNLVILISEYFLSLGIGLFTIILSMQ
jgi:hypothetical protein